MVFQFLPPFVYDHLSPFVPRMLFRVRCMKITNPWFAHICCVERCKPFVTMGYNLPQSYPSPSSTLCNVWRLNSYEKQRSMTHIKPLNPELNPICYLLALLGAHHFLHVSRIRVKLLTFRLLMSMYIYIYGAPILDVSRSHATTQHIR